MINIIPFIIKNKKAITTTVIAIICLALILLFRYTLRLKEENNRLETNQVALSADLNKYKTKSGNNAAKVIELQLKNSEFKKLCQEQKDIIKDMGIKLKRLESVSTTGTKTEIHKKLEIHDTIIREKIDTVYTEKKLKRFEWCDNWTDISGIIYNDSVELLYTNRDTLTVAAVRVPKKFLFFRWGTKYVEVHVSNRNPYTEITYNKSIKIKK